VFTFEGVQISEITSFIARASDVEEEKIALWPHSAPDREKVVGIFERFGLPDRLD
jgi:hypothetical protein